MDERVLGLGLGGAARVDVVRGERRDERVVDVAEREAERARHRVAEVERLVRQRGGGRVGEQLVDDLEDPVAGGGGLVGAGDLHLDGEALRGEDGLLVGPAAGGGVGLARHDGLPIPRRHY